MYEALEEEYIVAVEELWYESNEQPCAGLRQARAIRAHEVKDEFYRGAADHTIGLAFDVAVQQVLVLFVDIQCL